MTLFNNKNLLITGGTGSFGNAVLRRFLDTDIKEIRIFSRDEKKQDDMRHQYQNPKIKFYIGDVRDKRSVDDVMIGVDYIFHAAALKQVPSCEFFPIQAVRTNIMGTQNVLDSAAEHEVKRVVVLSTDKAAYPINAMGMSKALMEKTAVAKARALGDKEPVICCTRYGQRDGESRFGDSAVDRPNQKRKTDHHHRPQHDALYDDARRCGGFGCCMLSKTGVNGDLFVQKAPAATLMVLATALKELYRGRQ